MFIWNAIKAMFLVVIGLAAWIMAPLLGALLFGIAAFVIVFYILQEHSQAKKHGQTYYGYSPSGESRTQAPDSRTSTDDQRS